MTEAPESGTCFNCDTEVESDFYCWGCQEYVCGDCERSLGCFGSHEPDDHLIPDDEEW